MGSRPQDEVRDDSPGKGDPRPGEGNLPPGEGDLPPGEGDLPPGEGDLPPEAPDEALLDAALNLLSARVRSTEELRDRLRRKGFGKGEVEGCLRWLEERSYLDDDFFARAWIRDRVRLSPRSAALLRSELRRKGVDGPRVDQAMEEVLKDEGLTELELARKAARAWVRKQSPRTLEHLLGPRFSEEREKARRRLYGYLARRGFRGEAARAGMEAGEEEARRLRAPSRES